jgi:S-DNA-T family DNA segregation ATPase FtsK/SpoIIIE
VTPSPSPNGAASHDVIDVTETAAKRVTLAKASVTGDAPADDTERGPGGERLMPPPPRLPGWVRDPRAHLDWWLQYLWRLAGAWALQSLGAAGKATRRSLYRGPRQAVVRTHAWATDPPSKQLLDQLAEKTATIEWLNVSRERREAIGQHRPWMALAGALAVVATLAGGLLAGELPVKAFTAVAWVAVFGAYYGKDPTDPLFAPVTLKDPKYRKLEVGHLHRAFVAAGLASDPDKPGRPGPLDIVIAPHREGPNAQVATVDLPHGKVASDAVKARKAIASGLRCRSECLFLSADRFSPDTHDGRVIVRQTRTDPMAGAAIPTPLLTMDHTDIFSVLPVGLDERGDLVTISPLWRSILFSGMARTGKSFSARLLTLAMVLDWTVRVGAVFCAKGSSDHQQLARLAYASGFGDDDDVRRLLAATLRTFVDEIVERNKEIAKLPVSARREGKLTKALLKRFPVTLILLEEVQDFFSNGDRKDKLGLEIERLVIKLVKKGPSVGFITILATQRPDRESIPTKIKDQFQLRVGLRNTGDAVQVMAMGSGSADLGFDVRSLPVGDQYRGVSYIVGEGIDARYLEGGTICRWHYASEEDAEAIIDRALTMRIERELLSGMAAGQEVDTGVVTLLDDVAAVFAAGDLQTTGSRGPWLWSHEILRRLDEAFPGRYRYDPQSFGVAARGVGLVTESISQRVEDGEKTKPRTNAGLTLETVARALAERAERLDQDDDDEEEAA